MQRPLVSRVIRLVDNSSSYIDDEPLSDLLDRIYDNYDTVIICYAPYMIGAHDDPNSFNRSTFNFFDTSEQSNQ